jgi:hypothetical protein
VGAERLIARGQASISEYAGPLDDATAELIETLTAPR